MTYYGICKTVLAAIAIGAAALSSPLAAPLTVRSDFYNETPGAESKTFLGVVGVWRVDADQGRKVLSVDGRQWKEGQASAGIAENVRVLYGERSAEFIERVRAHADYPYAVFKDVTNFHDGEITVRFEGLSGRIDQGAGILFNLKPNGDYLTIRANCLEDNLILFKFENGQRSQVKAVRNTPTAGRAWHDLKVRIAGAKVEGYLDGKLYLEHTLPGPVSGRTGLWSKADSYMYFYDFVVTQAD